MGRTRRRWLTLIVLFNFLCLLSISCFAGNFLGQGGNQQRGILKKQSLEQNERYETRLEQGLIVRDYSKLSRNLDNSIKQSLLASGVKLEEITKVEDKKESKKLGLQWVDQVVWNYWRTKVNASQAKVQLPEIALRLTGQIEKNGGKVLKTIWEENPEIRSVTMEIGFLLENGKTSIPFVTHSLNLGQSINSSSSSATTNGVKARIALIIDDFGAMMPGTMEMLSIDGPLTVAVLPYRSNTAKEAQLAKERGHQVILHLPMEPTNPKTSPGPGAIMAGMEPSEVKELFNKAIAQVPQARGVNNHMGSKATEDRGVVTSILEEVKARNLFFVDSHTSPKSVVIPVANQLGVPAAENYLFIDNIDQVDAVKKEIRSLAKIALTRGKIIGIGHVRVATAQAIGEMIPELESQGIRLVFVSELVNK